MRHCICSPLKRMHAESMRASYARLATLNMASAWRSTRAAGYAPAPMCAVGYARGSSVRRAVCGSPNVRDYTMRRGRLVLHQRFLVLRRAYARPNASVSKKTTVKTLTRETRQEKPDSYYYYYFILGGLPPP